MTIMMSGNGYKALYFPANFWGFGPFDSTLVLLFSILYQPSDLFLAANDYAAPELESGAYTWQSDVYSFGVVMLELLTGRQPYER